MKFHEEDNEEYWIEKWILWNVRAGVVIPKITEDNSRILLNITSIIKPTYLQPHEKKKGMYLHNNK